MHSGQSVAGGGKTEEKFVMPPELALDLGRPKTFNIVSLREFLPLGQRVEAFALDQWQNGQWVQFAAGTSIGSHRLIRGAFITTSQVRLRIIQRRSAPPSRNSDCSPKPALPNNPPKRSHLTSGSFVATAG